MAQNDLRQARAARNQSLFREVNARLVELNEAFEQLTERSAFVCECANLDCIVELELKLGDYERIRGNARRFLVAPSDEHVLPDVERIVERHPTYFVVEKVGVGAEIAEAVAAG